MTLRGLLVLSVGLAALGSGCSRTATKPALPGRPDLSAFPPALASAVTEAEAAVRGTPAGTVAWLQLGRLYHANGFFPEARQCFGAALAEPGPAAMANYYLADAARAASDLGEEVRCLRETLRLDSTYVPARLRLAEALYKSGEPEAAIEAFQAVLERDPGNARARLGLARERISRGDSAGATEILEKLATDHPEFCSTYALLAQLLEKRGETGRIALFRDKARARKDPPPPDPWMAELMRSCFDVLRLSIAFEDDVKAGNEADALTDLRRLETVAPNHWLVCRIRGLALAQQGRLADAVQEYERAAAAGGDATKLYPVWVATLVALNRLPEAEEKARAGLRLVPRTPELLVALGELRWKQHDQTEALRVLTDALAIDPQSVRANRVLSQIAWENGDRDKAVTYLKVIEQSALSDIPTRALLGQYHLEKGEPAEAIAPLAAAAAIDPKNAAVAEMLALAHLRNGNRLARDGAVTEALDSYDAAIAVQPALAEAYANKAQVLLRTHESARAEPAIRSLLALQPDNPAAYLLLGDVQAAGGDAIEARQSWRKAAELLGPGGEPRLRAALDARLAP